MNNANGTVTLASVADPCRPLALTPRENLKGYLGTHLGRGLLFFVTFSSVLAVLLILVFVVLRSGDFFSTSSIVAFIAGRSWRPTAEEPAFGALAIIVGSLYVSLAVLVFAVPLGITAAVFLSDIVSWRIRNVVKPLVEILAAIPSVAYGFFAVLVLAPWMQKHFGFSTGTNALNAALILAVMALPTIVSVAEDSVSALGRELREGGDSGGPQRDHRGDCPGHDASHRRDHGGLDGLGQRHPDSAALVGLVAVDPDDDGDHCRGNGRGAGGVTASQCPVRHRRVVAGPDSGHERCE
jgi:hypothetical protein